MRPVFHLLALLSLPLALSATTLEKLSLDEMISKSTSIVRGKVLDSAATQRGNIIYTTYRLQVSERIKGATGAATVEVNLPGGSLGKLRQSFAGTPVLAPGKEYVVFIWVSPKGLSQVIGLGQGVFDVAVSSTGKLILSRGPLEAEVLDSAGHAVNDSGLKLTLDQLKATAAQMGVR